MITSTASPDSPTVHSVGPWWRRSLTIRQIAVALSVALAVIGTGSVLGYYHLRPRYPFLNDEPPVPPDSRGAARANLRIESEAFSLIPKDEILPGGPPKDGIPALTDPKAVPAADSTDLLGTDRVIGVVIAGQARSYPLRLLNWHEIVNDTLGGRPIAVTYCPLCDSAVVFDREIGGRVREFGVSGLLYNSNVLMYDRHPGDPSMESLWSQMMLRAVIGPAAEQRLEISPLPAQLMTWQEWKTDHPDTTTVTFETGYSRDYEGNPYEHYFARPDLMFPAKTAPGTAPPPDDYTAKEPTIVIVQGRALKGYPTSRLKAALAGGASAVTDTFAGKEFRFEPIDSARGIYRVTGEDGNPVPTIFTFWFELRVMHPAAEVFEVPRRTSAVGNATSETFASLVLKAGRPVLVDFWAEWCGPCRAMAPVVESIANDRRESISVVRVDVMRDMNLAADYDVVSLPTLVLFRDDRPVARHAGFLDRAGLEEFLAANGATP